MIELEIEMNDAPKKIFLNEYDCGLSGGFFTDRSAAEKAGTAYSENKIYLRTHEYGLVQS